MYCILKLSQNSLSDENQWFCQNTQNSAIAWIIYIFVTDAKVCLWHASRWIFPLGKREVGKSCDQNLCWREEFSLWNNKTLLVSVRWKIIIKLYLPLSNIRKEMFMFVMTEFAVYSLTDKYSGLWETIKNQMQRSDFWNEKNTCLESKIF